MMYYNFVVGDNTYKLRLSTRNLIALEKQIGCNPLALFASGDRVPTVTEMVAVLFHSLQQFNHGIGINEAYEIFDEYLVENSITDFIPVMLEIYKVSGIIKQGNTEKN